MGRPTGTLLERLKQTSCNWDTAPLMNIFDEAHLRITELEVDNANLVQMLEDSLQERHKLNCTVHNLQATIECLRERIAELEADIEWLKS